MLSSLTIQNFFGLTSMRQQARVAALVRSGRPVSQPARWRLGAAVVLSVLSAGLLASYLVSVNSYAATGYQIRQMQKQLSDLTEANQKLNIKTAQVSSIVSVQAQALGADFVPAGTPQFLQVNQLSLR